jgi:hypothetical protein
MQAVRKRNPFTFQSDDGGDDRVVLDEQGAIVTRVFRLAIEHSH